MPKVESWKMSGILFVLCYGFVSLECSGSFIYGSPYHDKKQAFWEELASLRSNSEEKWCIIRDFNVVARLEEKQGGAPFDQAQANRKGKRDFKFEAKWLIEEDCPQIIKEGWEMRSNCLNTKGLYQLSSHPT
ncbi:hypothetical protein V6N11_077000 [Hibiscus sabdariffa]|uniref:Uncharacterized protein n=1 Tax=Hibiscus sabdariffa TaxID=183260 RepID=A0ABR2TBS0_9ROSI